MSLKAKIEAVIYASEEPVTLAQLAGLLGHEAQAELDLADSAQQTLSLNETEAQLEAAAELDPTLNPATEAGSDAQPSDEASAEPQPELATEPQQQSPDPQPTAAARAEKARTARLRLYFRTLLDQLIAVYSGSDRGLEIREVAGGFRFATKPEYHDAVRGFVKSLKPPLKLTLQSLETLAVVAYKQPVTAPEISEIRGVDSGGVLGSLIARKLITTAGRKHVIGRPILYKTTRDFLLKFGLKDLSELPSIEEFEKLAGQLAEQEEIPMEDVSNPHRAPESPDELEAERRSESAQADGDSNPLDGDSNPLDAPADNVSDQTGDKASIDGRIPSLPPAYNDEADDPSAREAEIQSRES